MRFSKNTRRTVRLWDASALVPLFVKEARTPDVEKLLSDDLKVIVWWAGRTEVKSAIHRKVREGIVAPSDANRLLPRIDASLGERALEIFPEDAIRDKADALLIRYPLRAADASEGATVVP